VDKDAGSMVETTQTTRENDMDKGFTALQTEKIADIAKGVADDAVTAHQLTHKVEDEAPKADEKVNVEDEQVEAKEEAAPKRVAAQKKQAKKKAAKKKAAKKKASKK